MGQHPQGSSLNGITLTHILSMEYFPIAPQVTIREALQELVAWSQTAELKLVDHEENGRRTSLIRDWSDVFLELGDKQSLLASLKESQFFKAFEDQGITYEVRNEAARPAR